MTKLRNAFLAGLVCALVGGCPPAAGPDGASGGDSSSGDVSASALGYLGSVSGSVQVMSTTDGQPDPASGRKYFSRMQATTAVAWFTDLAGNRLKDQTGTEYPSITINDDGTYQMAGLPVGADILLNIDLNGDGVADLTTIINIPKDENAADSGALDGAVVDPLSTVAQAKLRALLQELQADPSAPALSGSGLIGQIRDAYEHLFEEAGISGQIDFDQIAGMSPEELAAFFDQYVPSGVRRGMNMARQRIALTVAADVESIVLAAARILLEGGLAIADEPGGVDLSELARLPNVETMTFEEYFGSQVGNNLPADGGGNQPAGKPRPVPPEFAQAIPKAQMTVYVNTAAEVDRNVAVDDQEGSGPGRRGPMIGEHILIKMGEAYLAQKTISMGELQRILVDPARGLGLRLMYGKFVGPGQPPAEVFQTASGEGIVKDVRALMTEVMKLGLFDPSPEAWERHQAAMRQILAEFLRGTAAPTFDQLFEGTAMQRVPRAEEFARLIREKRIHVPFSLSGPDLLHVVANADPFRDPAAAAVTVDVVADSDGVVQTVAYNARGEGKYYVAYGFPTPGGQQVDLLRRSNGRPLHDSMGRRANLDLANATVFQPVGGKSFFDAFSITRVEWPLAPALKITNPGFDYTKPPDPVRNPAEFQAVVLMNAYGPDGVPARATFDDTNGVATYALGGPWYLLADEGFPNDGKVALISSTGELKLAVPGDPASRVRIDPAAVVGLPVQKRASTWVYGIDVPNPAYNPDHAPYWDDINNNGAPDAGEPVFSERMFLMNPNDWRSTFVERYYRRADNNGFPVGQDIAWQANSPRLRDGTPLVGRNFRPRLNGFRFGQPNLTVNLMLAFAPADFFNGAQAINEQTRINPFMALALVNLVMGTTQTVEALVDFDGPGPTPPHLEDIPAHFFMPPVGDPVQLVTQGFEGLAQ